MTKKPTIRIAPMSALKPDPRNANKHTERGQSMVERSMSERGFARPGFAAKDGTVLGGNLSVVEVASSLGMDEVIIVESDGTRPIVHMRTDLEPDSDAARMLAIEDNRTAEVSLDWDASELLAAANELDLSKLFSEQEMEALKQKAGDMSDVEFKEYDESVADDVEYITCPHCGQKFPK